MTILIKIAYRGTFRPVDRGHLLFLKFTNNKVVCLGADR
jgi:hypothetical protein